MGQVPSFNRYLLRVPYTPGAVLGAEDVAVNRTVKTPAVMEPTFQHFRLGLAGLFSKDQVVHS